MPQKNSDQQVLAHLQFFSIAEVAAILGVSRRLVSTWISEGRLPVFRVGRRCRLIRIRKIDLEHFIETNIRSQPAQWESPSSDTRTDLA